MFEQDLKPNFFYVEQEMDTSLNQNYFIRNNTKVPRLSVTKECLQHTHTHTHKKHQEILPIIGWWDQNTHGEYSTIIILQFSAQDFGEMVNWETSVYMLLQTLWEEP